MPRVAKATKNAANVAKKIPAKKKKNGYDKPEEIPRGEILTDISKKQWKIGPSIGMGGFGEIYSACKATNSPKNLEDYDHVVKIEPHENGPLFVEMHFYMRNAKLEDITNFCKKKGLKSLGMPHLIGSGSHEINGIKHRFIVMPRYGKDIWSYFLANNRQLPEHTCYRLAIQMIDVFEYVHGCTYVHADLKGANMLVGLGKSGATQAYLVDFGLASHYTTKDFKPDPKKMHNGTIEYTSRDAHNGVPTMRGDLEILGYNLINWMGVKLPWESGNMLSNPTKVQNEKEEFMKNTDKALEKLFQKVPDSLKEFFRYISSLKFNDVPDYEKCRKIFQNALKSLGKTNSGELDFKLQKSATNTGKLRGKTSSSDFVEKKEKPDKKNLIKSSSSPSPLKRQKGGTTETPNKKLKTEPRSPSPKKKIKIISSNSVKRNFSPVVSINKNSVGTPSSTKKHGNTIINDNTTPNSKCNKTYEINFELDVSLDANVVVNVRRKKRGNNEMESNAEIESSSSTPVVRIRKLNTSGSEGKSPRRGRSVK